MNVRVQKTSPVLIGDRTFQVTSDDLYLDNLNGVFEPDSVELFRTLVSPNDIALDIGANIGCTGILLSTLVKKVICFEPSPTTFTLLQKNIGAAGAVNVHLINAGLGRREELLQLVFHPSNRSGGFVTTEVLEGHTVEAIKILQGDSYVQGAKLEQPIGFIKIDVEGFELDVIEGLAQTIATHKPVVTLELNHWCLNAFRRMSVPDFLDALRAVFPILYAVGKNDAKNLHNPIQSYHVMHEHIVHFDYPSIVGAFDEGQLSKFLDHYIRRGPVLQRPGRERQQRTAEVADLRAQFDAQQAQHECEQRTASESISQLSVALAAMKNSTSWRLTAPLRAIRNLFRIDGM